MPIGRSAKKSLRKTLRNKKTNYSFKTKLKDVIKSFLTKPSEKAYVEAQSLLDQAKNKKIWHKNKVSRLKSELSKKIGQTEVAAVKTAAKAKKKTAKKKVVRKTNKKM